MRGIRTPVGELKTRCPGPSRRARLEEQKRWRSVLDSNQRAAQCDHGLANRCLGPTRPTLHVCVAAEQPPLVWYPRRDSNPQNPVSETGTYASSVTGAKEISTSAVPVRDHPVGCGVSLHVAPAGQPRTSPPPPSPAVATTACTGTAEVGRTTARHLKKRRGALAAVAEFVARPAASRQCAGPTLRQFVKQRLAAPWRGPRGAITVCVEREKTKPENKTARKPFGHPGRLGHLV